MTIEALANEYVSLSRSGKFDEIMRRLLSPDVVRIEPIEMTGTPTVMRGIDAIIENSRGFAEDVEVHRVDIDGPFLGDGQFAVRFAIDVTVGSTGERAIITKMELNTVENGVVTRNEVFYNANPASVEGTTPAD